MRITQNDFIFIVTVSVLMILPIIMVMKEGIVILLGYAIALAITTVFAWLVFTISKFFPKD